MRPTKSQFEQMKPEVLHAATQAVGSVIDRFSGTVDEVESAQRTIAENFLGTAGDAERENISGKIADLHRTKDSFDGAKNSLVSAGDSLNSATNNLRNTVQQVETKGFTIQDNWQLQPARSDQKYSAKALQDAQIVQQQLNDSVKAWDEADRHSSQTIRKAVEQISVKTYQDSPSSSHAPQKSNGKSSSPARIAPSSGGGSAPPPAPPSNQPFFMPNASQCANAADVAHLYLGKNTADLVGRSNLPLLPNSQVDKNCANFVSAVLAKAGLIDPRLQTLSVNVLYNELIKQGWRICPAGQAPPGAVAVFGPGHNQHVELVSSNSGGKLTLVGSNNTNHDAADSQRVGYGNPYGTVTYLVPPA